MKCGRRNETFVAIPFQDDVTITDIINGSSAAAAAAAAMSAAGDASSACGSTGTASSERGIDVGRVGSWATDFEKLLQLHLIKNCANAIQN